MESKGTIKNTGPASFGAHPPARLRSEEIIPKLSPLFFIVPWLLLLFSCATSFDSRGVYHRVRSGENLLWIAKSYGVELQDLAEINNIQDMKQSLAPGEKLYIPPKKTRRYKKLPFEERIARHIEKRPSKFRESRETKKGSREIYTDHTRFDWPVVGNILSSFGIRKGRRHDGVDIKAQTGTPIRAADGGKVVFAGSMRGYGNLILLRHGDNFFTAYAHNSSNRVSEGQKIKKGQVIGAVGHTGRATGSHLHFEVREREKARNPLFFLPVVH